VAFYDYKCAKCANIFEIEKGMKESPKGLKCPKCGSADAKRVFTKIGVLSGASAFSDPHVTSGGSCSTCVDGVCSTCSAKN